jgi:hypothetical protein
MSLSWSDAFAQTASAPTTINDLKTPDSPAFVLLGVSPTQVETPTTPRALAVDVLSAPTGNTILPSNYALTVAPYWLQTHPTLTADEYFHPAPGQSFLQTFSLSFVTSKSSVIDGVSATAANATDVGWGARASFLLNGRNTTNPVLVTELRKLAEIRAKYLAATRALAGIMPEPNAALTAIKNAADDEIDKSNDVRKSDKDSVKNELNTLIDNSYAQTTPLAAGAISPNLPSVVLAALQSELDAGVTKVRNADALARGLMLSIAGAGASRVPDNGVSGTHFAKWGVWVTPAYRMNSPLLDIVGVFRINREPASATSSNSYDAGARIIQRLGPFGWSGEYIERWNQANLDATKTATERFTINVEYKLTLNIYLHASAGKDFANPAAAQTTGGLLTLFGLNFGFGEASVLSKP